MGHQCFVHKWLNRSRCRLRFGLWWSQGSMYWIGCTLAHLANTNEPSMCGGDAPCCQITLATCCKLLSMTYPTGFHSGEYKFNWVLAAHMETCRMSCPFQLRCVAILGVYIPLYSTPLGMRTPLIAFQLDKEKLSLVKALRTGTHSERDLVHVEHLVDEWCLSYIVGGWKNKKSWIKEQETLNIVCVA